jgi:hypothetical protein
VENPYFLLIMFICHTSSYQCTAITVGLSNTLFTNIASKNIPIFIKTPLIPAHFNLRHLFTSKLDAIPLDEFGQNSATLSPLYTRTSSRNPALGKSCCQALVPQVRHQDCVSACDANANDVNPPADAAIFCSWSSRQDYLSNQAHGNFWIISA